MMRRVEGVGYLRQDQFQGRDHGMLDGIGNNHGRHQLAEHVIFELLFHEHVKCLAV
jgi:hypothetical protein